VVRRVLLGAHGGAVGAGHDEYRLDGVREGYRASHTATGVSKRKYRDQPKTHALISMLGISGRWGC
jgi:hypothetical protein